MRVGIDSVEIERIEKSLNIPGFKERVFSPEETAFLDGKGSPAQSYAANFAAKEAFSKALSRGMAGMAWSEISILRDELGAPYIELSGRAKEAAKGISFTVSLTHTRNTATAIVIAFEDKG